MNPKLRLIKAETLQLFRDRTFLGLMSLLLILMTAAVWNTSMQQSQKREQLEEQLAIVKNNDIHLAAEIDSLINGLANFEDVYTLPTSGVRLTYNNHRIAWLPLQDFSLLSIGQGDLHSNYKKIVLYFNESYEMSSQELVSPIEQLFGQLDLAFVWVYLLPLIIILVSFNILSQERETGRLPLIASQPLKVSRWLLTKIAFRFSAIILLLVLFTAVLLSIFGVPVLGEFGTFIQLIVILSLYSAFWFFLSFLVNLAGYSSGRSLIVLTSAWVFFVFVIPSIINQTGKELHTLPSRLEIINHHQASYNEMERDLEQEKEALFVLHPDWDSDDPATKDMSNSTGWNIDYLAKQYIAQVKHQPIVEEYESQIDERNDWFGQFRMLSPALITQSALNDMAGTSSRHYRSFLRQAKDYASDYRQYVFKRLFNNYTFTSEDIKNLPPFEYDQSQVPNQFVVSLFALLSYLVLVALALVILGQNQTQIK